MATPTIGSARIVLPCRELSETLGFFVDQLGFRVDAISPADDPARATISGHGLRIELQRGLDGPAGLLRLTGTAGPTVAPNGTRIEWVADEPPVVLPPLREERVVTRIGGGWTVGRAGMAYRDLLPGRFGGRFVASHIRIPEPGPVPDYVHYHVIRLQLIYCYRGRVRVVYEDQGPPFDMLPGDCVLQPPRIRHRVLESSGGLEVIELGSPAEHATIADHGLPLPNRSLRPLREFDGQRFVRHEAGGASWQRWGEGFEARDTGIAAATNGLADVRVIRPRGASSLTAVHQGELSFRFLLAGGLTLDGERLSAGDSFAIPAGVVHTLGDLAADTEWLEVSVPRCR